MYIWHAERLACVYKGMCACVISLIFIFVCVNWCMLCLERPSWADAIAIWISLCNSAAFFFAFSYSSLYSAPLFSIIDRVCSKLMLSCVRNWSSASRVLLFSWSFSHCLFILLSLCRSSCNKFICAVASLEKSFDVICFCFCFCAGFCMCQFCCACCCCCMYIIALQRSGCLSPFFSALPNSQAPQFSSWTWEFKDKKNTLCKKLRSQCQYFVTLRQLLACKLYLANNWQTNQKIFFIFVFFKTRNHPRGRNF